MLGNIDPKKYPRTPEHMWNRDADIMTADQLKFLALAMADNGDEIRKQMK